MRWLLDSSTACCGLNDLMIYDAPIPQTSVSVTFAGRFKPQTVVVHADQPIVWISVTDPYQTEPGEPFSGRARRWLHPNRRGEFAYDPQGLAWPLDPLRGVIVTPPKRRPADEETISPSLARLPLLGLPALCTKRLVVLFQTKGLRLDIHPESEYR